MGSGESGAAGDFAAQHAPEFDDRRIGGQLLDIAFNTRLRLVFDDHASHAQHVRVQFRLAWTVAAYRVDVHAGFDHVGRDDGGVGFVGGDGGDDVGAAYGVRGGCGAHDLQRRPRGEIAHEFAGCGRIDIEHADLVDTQQFEKGDRLEFALRAIADQGHFSRLGTGECPRDERGGGGRAQRGGERQLRKEQRIAGIDRGQRAERHHGMNAAFGVDRMSVDVFEGEQLVVGHRHRFDYADARMTREARRFVEIGPAQIVGAERPARGRDNFRWKQ
ncbi:hypothetical protein GGD41_003429 [Paraburkholderia bryophila]|uniref:Uncharacterized protein n=1 Tax=Paraburkholderia bryophila TaxID=420952 RepID=A0A7Y9W9J9_9BURK|nr:hypothetical protein [Paraburkholderia bryophila]